MKQAVIQTGGKQYIVREGEELEVELLKDDKKLGFTPLLVFDGKDVQVGTPEVTGVKVTAEVLRTVKNDKVTAIRFKAKKRVKKVRGHRQQKSVLKIKSIK